MKPLLPPRTQWVLLLAIFVLTCLLPAAISFGMDRANKKLNDNNGLQIIRFGKIVIASVFLYTGYYLLKDYLDVSYVAAFMLSATITAVIALIVSAFWKISIYTLAWGNLCGMLYYLCLQDIHTHLWMLLIVIMISGVAGWNRIKEMKHKPSEVYVGLAVGFCISMAVFMLLYW